jgi:hypothetical protein
MSLHRVAYLRSMTCRVGAVASGEADVCPLDFTVFMTGVATISQPESP